MRWLGWRADPSYLHSTSAQPNVKEVLRLKVARENLAELAAEKIDYFVILSGAKNLSFFSWAQTRRDSSLRSE